jgi:hypothetical protein
MKEKVKVIDPRERLARDFATAFIATKMGVTFRTAENYAGNKLGDLWFFLADVALKADEENIKSLFKIPTTEPEPANDLEN